jgi:hypothetical protein
MAQYHGTGTGAGGTESGALLVVDLDGRVRAFWQYPEPRPLGIHVVANPREVVADPSSEPDDERFVLICDCRGADFSPVPFPIQEFSYSASKGTITPKSTAVRAAQDYSGWRRPVSARTARCSWPGRVPGACSPTRWAVYPKVGRERGLVTRTPAVGNWPVNSWGTTNTPDYLVAGTDRSGLVRSVTYDPRSGAVVTAGLNGLVQAVLPARSGGRMTFRVSRGIDVGLNRLRGPASRYIGVRRGAIDAERRILWIPVNQMVLDGLPWPYPPFKLDQWLLSVNLDVLLPR